MATQENVAKLDITQNYDIQIVGTRLVVSIELDADKVDAKPSSTGKTMLLSKAAFRLPKGLGGSVLVYGK